MRCRISILTEADGERSVTVRQGEVRLDGAGGATITFCTDEGIGSFFTDGERAVWKSAGEMKTELFFDVNERTKGVFSAAGASGETVIETHGIVFETKDDRVAAEIDYTLYFDYGEANMRVKISARVTEPSVGWYVC